MRLSWDFIRAIDVSAQDALANAPLDESPLPVWIAEMLSAKSLKRNQVVHASRLNQTFAYQIISGSRHATRDKLIQLAFGMQLSIDDASELLERGGTNALSPRCRRDVLIAYALDRSLSVLECDDLLWLAGERTLVTRGTARRF